MNKHAPLKKNSSEPIMHHTLQKPCRKLLCIALNLRQNISKLKLKTTSSYTKNIKTLLVSYPKGKEINIVIIYEKRFGQ